MEPQKKMLSIGTEFFDDIRSDDFYYIDKTGLIRDLINNRTKVTLITRPRRFGKSLNMSMLEKFFDLNGDKHLFDGLEISKETVLCDRYMGKYPVIFISLNMIDRPTYDDAVNTAVSLIVRTVGKYHFLLDSDRLDETDKAEYKEMLDECMNEKTMCASLRILSRLLEKHFDVKPILLIDEYDVPLARSSAHGYYDRMLNLIRTFYEEVLKFNDSLEFAVLTGCLNISKEILFAGLNDLKVCTVADDLFSPYFGFTEREVRQLLSYYGIDSCYDGIKYWYDGYRFGNTDVYCPWDILNHCRRLIHNPKTSPKNYWISTSGNDIIPEFLSRIGTESAKQEIQTLTDNGSVPKKITLELSYREMYDTIDNIWSLLYITGYLTSRSRLNEDIFELSITNNEVRKAFRDEIRTLFFEYAKKDTNSLNILCNALQNADTDGAEQSIHEYLRKIISIPEPDRQCGRKTNEYHWVFLNLLQYRPDWNVSSSYETGDGYGDILIRTKDKSFGSVIEVKYAYDGNLENAASEALKRIEMRRYTDALYADQCSNVLKYGIGFYKRNCRVLIG